MAENNSGLDVNNKSASGWNSMSGDVNNTSNGCTEENDKNNYRNKGSTKSSCVMKNVTMKWVESTVALA